MAGPRLRQPPTLPQAGTWLQPSPTLFQPGTWLQQSLTRFQQVAQQALVVGAELGHEAGQRRLAVLVAVEFGVHPPGGEPVGVLDGEVRVAAALALAADDALLVQPGQDGRHRRTGEAGGQLQLYAARCEGRVGGPEGGHDGSLQLARRTALVLVAGHGTILTPLSST